VHRKIYAAHVYTDVMHLIDCLISGRASVLSGERACHVIEIIEKGYQAAREARTVELTPVSTPAFDRDEMSGEVG
jgi:predicted dehydrogenase